MKKEQMQPIAGFTFKFFSLLMLMGSFGLVHFEYLTHKIMPLDEPEIMNVRIETKQIEPLEDVQQDIASEMVDNLAMQQPTSTDIALKSSANYKMEQYRIHLSVVANLCTKFLKHENYEEELVFLHKNADDYPDDIAKILSELQEYENKYLAQQSELYTKLNLEGGIATRIVNKIIDIEKKNPEYEMLAAEHKKISAQLERLMAYFYSKGFFKKYYLG
jgi:hypothetical protein